MTRKNTALNPQRPLKANSQGLGVLFSNFIFPRALDLLKVIPWSLNTLFIGTMVNFCSSPHNLISKTGSVKEN